MSETPNPLHVKSRVGATWLRWV